MSQTPLLYLRSLHKRMQGQALAIEDLSLRAGHCILLRGANGAGKSTLMRVLAGLLPADQLSLDHRGVPIPATRQRATLRRHCIYLHQQPYLFDCSVYDNIDYGLRRRSLPRHERRRRVQSGLAWGGLQHLAQRNARQLSGGERQRVALARAQALQPALLLLDEPTNGLDIDARTQALRLIAKLRETGASIMLSSHEVLPESDAFVDLGLYLQAGQLHPLTTQPSPPAALTESPARTETMLESTHKRAKR